ncbi:helicase associated domain-containing protein [Streptomyces sp. NPDC093093]|uniref:helicase associated domain-containing protein n=1 Tax=Streptomyces sp. NPDC093093 TaxID=3366025 RepID=UPI0037F59EF7
MKAGTALDDVAPGVTVHSDDVGPRPATQCRDRDRERLSAEQRERLAHLGATAAPKPVEPRSGGNAFDRGVEALAQYAACEGRVVVPWAHTEELPNGTAVRLGVWLSNTRSRRDGLSADRRERLADLGIDWRGDARPVGCGCVPVAGGGRSPGVTTYKANWIGRSSLVVTSEARGLSQMLIQQPMCHQ